MLYNQPTSRGQHVYAGKDLVANLHVVVTKGPMMQAGGAPEHSGAPVGRE